MFRLGNIDRMTRMNNLVDETIAQNDKNCIAFAFILFIGVCTLGRVFGMKILIKNYTSQSWVKRLCKLLSTAHSCLLPFFFHTNLN